MTKQSPVNLRPLISRFAVVIIGVSIFFTLIDRFVNHATVAVTPREISFGFARNLTQPSRMWITTYYQTYAPGDMPARAIDWRGLTHLIHIGESSNPDTTQNRSPWYGPVINLKDSLDLVCGGDHVIPQNSQNIPDSLTKYAHRNGVRVLLSIGGGWGRGASAMNWIASDSTRMQTYVDATLAFAKRHGYDGIEVDWEPPANLDDNSRLIRLYRRQLSHWTPRGELVLAVVNRSYEMYDLAFVDSVDQYNIMLYDMISNNDNVVGFNAPLYPPSQAYPSLWRWQGNYQGILNGLYDSTWSGPRRWIALGMPASKIGVGIPFYGYTFPDRTLPDQPRSSSSPVFTKYETVMKALNSGGVYHWEEYARVPWANGTVTASFGNWGFWINAGKEFFVTYEDTASLSEKVRWAKALGLGGIMICDLWYGYVPSASEGQRDPLLRAVVQAVGKKTESEH